jgi:hypothetical protein
MDNHPNAPGNGADVEVLERDEAPRPATAALAVLQPEANPLAAVLQKAEIDQQIATAKQYPRSIARAIDKINTLALLDEETAAECIYALKRGKKPIIGPSARFAEIVVQSWGNGRVDARVTHVDREEGYVEAEGVFFDLEENVATRRRIRRRITNKEGRTYNDDMIIVTGNAACSIAARNAVLAGVPKGVYRKAFDNARQVAGGTMATLAEGRAKAIAAFADFKVTPAQIFAYLEVKGEEDIGLDLMPILRGMYAALRNGEETVETMFSPRKVGGYHEKVENPLADKKPEVAASSGADDMPAGAAPSGKPEPVTASETPAKNEKQFPPDADKKGAR